MLGGSRNYLPVLGLFFCPFFPLDCRWNTFKQKSYKQYNSGDGTAKELSLFLGNKWCHIISMYLADTELFSYQIETLFFSPLDCILEFLTSLWTHIWSLIISSEFIVLLSLFQHYFHLRKATILLYIWWNESPGDTLIYKNVTGGRKRKSVSLLMF